MCKLHLTLLSSVNIVSSAFLTKHEHHWCQPALHRNVWKWLKGTHIVTKLWEWWGYVYFTFDDNNTETNEYYKQYLCVSRAAAFSILVLLLSRRTSWRLIAEEYQAPMFCCIGAKGRFVWIIHHHMLFTTALNNCFSSSLSHYGKLLS